MKLRILPTVVLLGVALCAPVARARQQEEFPGLGEEWRYYRSPHFELYSGRNDYSSRAILKQLELMRAVLLDNLKLKEKLPLPVTVYAFSEMRDFRGYLPPGAGGKIELIGYWANQDDRAEFTLAPVDDNDLARNLVYDQFITYLFRVAESDPARWYLTGVSQTYSTLREDRNSIVLGLPVDGWVRELEDTRMLPLEQLFGITNDSVTLQDPDKLSLYCAQCWAFLHYCRFGRDNLPKDKVEKFFHLAGDQKSQSDPQMIRQACQDLLGCDYPELAKRLYHHVASGDYKTERIAKPAFDDPKTYSRRDVSREEMTDRLAELSFRLGRDPRGKLLLLRDADRVPGETRLHEALGNDAYLDGDMITVREQWGKAVAMNTDNPAIYHELGQIESRRWFQQVDLYFRLPEATATELRNLLAKAIKTAPEQGGAYEMLAWVESAAPQVDVGHVNLIQAQFHDITDKASTLLALALIHLRLNDIPGAKSMLAALEKTPRDGNQARTAAYITGEINRREEKRAEAEAAEAAAEKPDGK